MAIFDASSVESKIGYVFKDKNLLRKCFVHASYGNERCEENNELLEFFGDAIIEFVVTEYLYANAKGDEGALTKKRADMVSKAPLLKSVLELGLDNYLLLGRGLVNDKTHDEKLYSSVYESLVAGIYLDGGIKPVKAFIKRTIIKDFENKQKLLSLQKINADSKSAFQDYVQKKHLGSISYETLCKTGPDHSPSFRVVALLNGKPIAEGKGKSKKLAEADAAKTALKRLQKKG